jgi:hypothetical protein
MKRVCRKKRAMDASLILCMLPASRVQNWNFNAFHRPADYQMPPFGGPLRSLALQDAHE